MDFFDSLFLGTTLIVINMGIQCSAVVILIRYLIRHEAMNPEKASFLSDLGIISFAVAVLFVGHLVQFLVWSEVFILVGEFTDLPTAFYHSIVNFSSLGYGDIAPARPLARAIAYLTAVAGQFGQRPGVGWPMPPSVWIASWRRRGSSCSSNSNSAWGAVRCR